MALTLACLAGLALPGCGKSERPLHPAKTASEATPLEGSLSDNVKKIQTHKRAESCDRDLDAIKKELAAALDAKQVEIDKYLATPAAPSEKPLYKKLAAGPTYFRERITPPQPTPGWQEDDYGWKSVHESYLTLKSKSVADAGDDWAWLNAKVRSLIVDDQDRVGGLNMYLDKNSGAPLANAIETLNQCLALDECDSLKFEPATERFLNSNYYLAENLAWIAAQTTRLQRRAAMTRTREYMVMDYSRYDFARNANVTLQANGTFGLPLDAGVFADVQTRALLTRFIETVWNQAGSRIKIDWFSAELKPSPFKFYLGDGAGERAYVSASKHEIHLFPGTVDKAIAHEMGHVLGFPDHYFTVWKPQGCKYTRQLNDDDLMSNHVTGSVTDEEWAELKRQYQRTPELPSVAVSTSAG